MALKTQSKMRKDFGIGDNELKSAKDFLQGAVYSWIKNRKGEVFALRDLMGGEHFDWDGTPLYCLYQKHTDIGKDNEAAIVEAGKDAGWILKSVLFEDKYIFESCDKGMARGYKWVFSGNPQ